MLTQQRRKLLLSLIRKTGTAVVTELEREMGVSRMTVYRDLDALVKERLVERVHGGVTVVEASESAPEIDPRAQPLDARMRVAAPAKRAIARHLLGLLSGQRTVLLDNSSTVSFLIEFLKELGSGGDIFLATGNVSLYSEILRRAAPHVRVALHGGEPHPRTGTLVGPMAIGSLREMRFDYCVMSCIGVREDEGAVFVASPEECEIKRVYLEQSRRCILVADRSKFGISGPYRMTDLSAFDYVVTERGVSEQLRSAHADRAAKKRPSSR